MTAEGYPLPDVLPSIVHMLERAVRTNPAGEAVSVGRVRTTYLQLAASVVAFANNLRRRGAHGDRVAIALPNRVDLAVALLGVMASGAQAVLLNPNYTARELEAILEDADPLLLICQTSGIEVMAGLIGKTTRASPIVLPNEDGALVQTSTESGNLATLLPEASSLAALLYTGGTTGRSKGVNLTHRTLSLNISQRCALLPLRQKQERILGMTPLFHAYATHMVLYPALYSSSAAIFLERYSAEAALDAICLENITFFAGAPTIYNGLIKHPKFESTNFSSLLGAYSGAAPLSVETLKEWERVTGVPIAEGYGLTEATGILCFNPLFGTRKAGSVGLPLPGVEIQIVDADSASNVLPIGALGEIRARGPQMMVGYRNRPEETAAILRDGWLYTGDIGELDDDGYLFVRDRKKDMALVGGFNVYPREIDEILHAHPDVVEAVSAGVPNSYWGETIAALVTRKMHSILTEEELIAFCARQLARYKVPTKIEFVSEIPRTAAGKIDRKSARAMLVRTTAKA
jgi:long-chain acyl-CoA synthetase